MLIKIKKLQFLCGICMLGQILFAMWLLPFHFVAVCISIVIVGWQRCFKVLQVQYHYYVIGLYVYRLWLLSISMPTLFQITYLALCLYVAIMILLCSFRAIL